jgi:hypothetical protein
MNMSADKSNLIISAERTERTRPYSPPTAESTGVMRIVDRMLAQPDFDIAKVQQMVEWYEANEARKAFHADMAEVKKNPPVILKNKHVGYNLKTGGRQDYDHATHDEVTLKIIAAMAPHGFSHRWIPTQPDGNVCVTCVITHRLGHSESLSLTAPPDTSGNKSPVQAILSTKTLLERHTLIAATGLTAADMPDADDRTDEDERPPLADDVKNALKDAAALGSETLAKCFQGLAQTTRARIVADYLEEWNALKADAAKVKKS